MAVRAAQPWGADLHDGPLAVHILAMRRRHLRQVMKIETQTYPRPWSVGLFMSELSLRSSRDYFVAKTQGSIVGYAGMMTHADEAHVTNIAVDPAWQRNHIATRLMIQLLRTALRKGVTGVTLEVRMSNHAAQSLYYQFGFAPAGTRKNYYPETREDALIMWAHGIDAPEYAERVGGVARRIPGTTVWAS